MERGDGGMNFLNELKIAVINHNIDKLKKMSEMKPEFESVEEANEMLKYIIEAKKILEKEKNGIFCDMKEIQKLKKFYNSSDKGKINFKV